MMLDPAELFILLPQMSTHVKPYDWSQRKQDNEEGKNIIISIQFLLQ